MIKCYLCNKEFKNMCGLSRHINNAHKEISLEDYYNKYLNINNLGFCIICNKKMKFKNISVGYSKYCNKCSKSTDEFKKKIKNTVKNKYGVDNVFQLEEVKNKIKQTNKKNLGVENPSQNKIIIRKVKNTCLNKYGVDSYSKTKEYKQRVEKTCEEKYGYKNPVNNNKIKQKMVNTIIDKYGVDHYTKTDEYRYRIFKKMISSDRLGNNIIPLFNFEEYKGIKKRYKFKCTKCELEFVALLDGGMIPKCPVCESKYVSQLEKDIRNYIINIYDKYMIFNDREIISPLELDIVLPDIRLAIEVNGTFWHSNRMKPPGYHENKVQLCESVGYKLIFIWEYDWEENREEVMNNIKNLIIG
jgi:very-short-patch-repair endonuclease